METGKAEAERRPARSRAKLKSGETTDAKSHAIASWGAGTEVALVRGRSRDGKGGMGKGGKEERRRR
eukprot:2728223-Rhodomonas_salina.1